MLFSLCVWGLGGWTFVFFSIKYTLLIIYFSQLNVIKLKKNNQTNICIAIYCKKKKPVGNFMVFKLIWLTKVYCIWLEWIIISWMKKWWILGYTFYKLISQLCHVCRVVLNRRTIYFFYLPFYLEYLGEGA
jgi:hypothetical protein